MKTQKILSFVLVSLFLIMGTEKSYSQDLWEPTNGPYGGSISLLAVSPNGDIYAGNYYYGVFRSTNNGDTWFRASNGLGDKAVKVLAINSFGHIFVGTSRFGVFRSTNDGENWTSINTGLPEETTVNAIAIDSNGNIFAGTSEDGVFHSTNNGDNWTQISADLNSKYIYGLTINSDDHIFAGTEEYGIYRSTDNGQNWSQINMGLSYQRVNSFAINSSGHIFAGTGEVYEGSGYGWWNTDYGVCRSTDNGDSWVRVNNGMTDQYNKNPAISILVINSNDHIFAGTVSGVYRSIDNGDNWTAVNNGLPPMYSEGLGIATLAINANGHIIAGNGWLDKGGSVFRSANNGDSWTEINSGLLCNPANSLLNSSSYVFAGTDEGLFRSADNGNIWTNINPELYCKCFARNSNGDIFAGTFGNGVYRSTDNGDNWTRTSNGLPDETVNSIAINSNEHIFAGIHGWDREGVYRSTDNGDNWTEINNGLPDDAITYLAINSSDHIFAGTDEGEVFRSTDNGDNWIKTGEIGGWSEISSLVINSNGHIFAGFSWSGGIYRSTDNGDNWTEVALFNNSVQCLAINSSGYIYAGTWNTGVIRSTNNGDNWEEVNTGLTEKSVQALSFDSNNRLFAATFNGGVFRSTDSIYPYDILFNPLANMETARYGLASITDGTYIYSICGGIYETPGKLTNIEKYDPAFNTWTEFVTGLIPRRYCSAEYLSSQNKIYIFNGDTHTATTYTDTVEIVDVATGNLTYSATHPYPTEYSGSAIWNNKIYVFGGSNSDGYSNRLYEFEPVTQTWTRLPDMPEAKQTDGEIVNGILYVFGGYNGNASTRIDAYDIQSGTWTLMYEMPVGISAHKTAVSGKYIWLIGSYDNLQSLAVYNTETNEFTRLHSNMTGRRHAGAAVMENYLYVFGGNQATGGPALSSLEYADISDYIVSVKEKQNSLPVNCVLYQNYPNPFNPGTTIQFSLPHTSFVTLKVYNILGEEVSTLVAEKLSAGNYHVEWDASGFVSGVYYYRLKTEQFVETRKLILLK